MDKAEKIRENRVRRMAERQGLVLRKSRRRDPNALDYGGYWLIDAAVDGLVAGDEWGWDIESIEEFLQNPEVEGASTTRYIRVHVEPTSVGPTRSVKVLMQEAGSEGAVPRRIRIERVDGEES